VIVVITILAQELGKFKLAYQRVLGYHVDYVELPMPSAE